MYPNIYFHEVDVNQYAVFQYPPYDLALASKLAEVAKREKLDIIHAHYAVPHAVCAFLAKQMTGHTVKVVTTLHGTDITVLGYDPSLKEVIRFAIESSDRVTAVSHSLAAQTYDLIKPDKKIDTIHNFVDERVYLREDHEVLKKHYGLMQDEKVIIHVSNFRKVKRVHDVIHVFKKISDQVHAKLLLIGDGPEKSVVCDLVKKLELTDRVLFLGKQEKVEELYSISDLKLLLSEKESFGLVLLEAMACGVPCIATDVGGIPEVIEHGETGFLVPLGDIEAAAKHAVSILKNKALHEQVSAAAQSSVQAHFSSEKIVSEYEELYLELIEGDDEDE